jgi:peroxiredoxin
MYSDKLLLRSSGSSSLFHKLIVFVVLGFALRLSAQTAVPGNQAPNFTGNDSNGKPHSLSDYHGKYVVLEWASQGCPYDQRHYINGSMEAVQQKWTGKGVVWLSIISSAPGQEGFVSPEEENRYIRKTHASPTAAILDPSGTIGRLYRAKTTPHMFVIDPSGKVIYAGAIDDNPTWDLSDQTSARNYVDEALTESMNGQPIRVQSTRPYGCSVKYAY